jgi:hypothetical protein
MGSVKTSKAFVVAMLLVVFGLFNVLLIIVVDVAVAAAELFLLMLPLLMLILLLLLMLWLLLLLVLLLTKELLLVVVDELREPSVGCFWRTATPLPVVELLVVLLVVFVLLVLLVLVLAAATFFTRRLLPTAAPISRSFCLDGLFFMAAEEGAGMMVYVRYQFQ